MKVQIKVYDMLGTEVAELVTDYKAAGFYETTFDASNLSSGVYIYRIIVLSGEKILYSQSNQMIFLK
ncbi:MAG TPA: T9SS type A sorting domain-containing protein [Ignavibacteriaceae bacterium]